MKTAAAGKFAGIDPILPLDTDDPELLPAVGRFYGLPPEALTALAPLLVTRSLVPDKHRPIMGKKPAGDGAETGVEAANAESEAGAADADAGSTHLVPKKIYLLNRGAHALLEADARERVKVTACGVRALERQTQRPAEEAERAAAAARAMATAGEAAAPADPSLAGPRCGYRLSQEGLPVLLPLVGRQVLRLTVREMRILLEHRGLRLPFAAPADSNEAGYDDKREALADPASIAAAAALWRGCCVVALRDEDAERLGLPPLVASDASAAGAGGAGAAPLVACCWRGARSLNALLSKEEGRAMAERLRAACRRGGKDGEADPLPAPPPTLRAAGAAAASK